jgi:hypothetical protein
MEGVKPKSAPSSHDKLSASRAAENVRMSTEHQGSIPPKINAKSFVMHNTEEW